MNINVNKNYDKLSVTVNEYSDDPNVDIKFLTTTPDDVTSSFDFINITVFDKEYKESANITFAKDALEKFVCRMEKAIKAYREKNLISIES